MGKQRVVAGLCTLAVLGVLSPASAVAVPTPSPGVHATPTAKQPTTYRGSTSAFAIGISPTRLVVGQRDIGTTQKVTVVNQGAKPVQVQVQKRNFTANVDGGMNYQDNAPYAAAKWVTVAPQTFTLKAGAVQIVTANITAPRHPEPGDHQVALVYMVPAGRTADNIKINRGIATPVYITVLGPIDTSMSLTDLRAPRFVQGGPVQITATMHNLGTVHRDFRAPSPLTIQAAGQPAAFPDFTVPRGAVRNISADWNPPFLCICHPMVTFDNAGVKQTASVRVIVFPWPWFAAGLGALLLILLGSRLARRGYRLQVQKAAAAYNSGSGGDA